MKVVNEVDLKSFITREKKLVTMNGDDINETYCVIIPQYTQMSNESLCYTSGTNICYVLIISQ